MSTLVVLGEIVSSDPNDFRRLPKFTFRLQMIAGKLMILATPLLKVCVGPVSSDFLYTILVPVSLHQFATGSHSTPTRYVSITASADSN